MDKKEAIQVLQTALTAPFVYGAYAEAIGMAIESLSVESSDDLISRTAAIKAVANAIWHYPNECYRNLNIFDMAEALAKDALLTLPPAGIPTKCIAQINIDTDEVVKRIKDEYEIVDKPIGEWIPRPYEIDYENDAECSICGEIVIDGNGYNYCPNCGIKMKSKKEEK